LDVANNDYHVKPTDLAAINSGISVGIYDESPILGLPDIGAYESTYSAGGSGSLCIVGTAYRWSNNSIATSNSNRFIAYSLNDGDLTTDVPLNGGTNDNINTYEAAGLIFDVATNVVKVEFINGFYGGSYDNGSYDSGIAIQTTTDGSTWENASGWSINPAYQYCDPSISGTTYIFTGNAKVIKGIRVVGKVHTSATSGSWEVRVREITAYSTDLTSGINTGVKPSITNEVNLYPNPTNNVIGIRFGEQVGKAYISIFNIQGSILLHKLLANINIDNIDIDYLKSGVYFIKIDNGNNIQTKKIIKE